MRLSEYFPPIKGCGLANAFELLRTRNQVHRARNVPPGATRRWDLALIQRRGRVLSREQLLDAGWDRDTHVTDRAVDAHIVNLRRKIETHPAQPEFLVSVRGLGYRFDG